MLFAARQRPPAMLTQHWDVVIKGNHGPTGRTTRIGKNDRFLERHAVNDYIKKAANYGTEDACENVIDGRS